MAWRCRGTCTPEDLACLVLAEVTAEHLEICLFTTCSGAGRGAGDGAGAGDGSGDGAWRGSW